MTSPQSTLAQNFESLFGNQPNGCDLETVVNSAQSSRIVGLCRAAMGHREVPVLLDYFEKWETSDPDQRHRGLRLVPQTVEEQLVLNGRWEAGWSVARLHLDQVMKHESASGRRYARKGHVLCNLALVGDRLHCPALVRHYAQLSSAGDFCRDSGPDPPGLAPVLMEPHESHRQHAIWRELVGKWLSSFDSQSAVFLEAYLAARWFRGERQKTIINLAKLKKGSPPSFLDLLFEVGLKCEKNERGTVFEAAAGLLLSATPGFAVYPCRSSKEEQIDLVVQYEPDCVAPPCLPRGYGLVECKSVEDKVPSGELRNFGMKCLLRRVDFGILFARSNITGWDLEFDDPVGAELTRRRFQNDGLTILVLDINQLRQKDRELRGLHDALLDDYHRLVFGRIVGE